MMTRYQSQLEDVRNNREYDNLSKEIEFQSLEIELLRKKINDAERLINLKTAISRKVVQHLKLANKIWIKRRLSLTKS